jgi:hypothetical protein
VSAGKCRRRVTLGPLNIRCTSEPVNPGYAPRIDLIRTGVIDWLTEL